MGVIEGPLGAVARPTVDRTTYHVAWRVILAGGILSVIAACYFLPVLALVLGVLVLVPLCARAFYRDRDRFIPNLYARDTRVYDDAYRAFIRRTMSDLRRLKIPGHTLLWEASQLPPPDQTRDELLLDLGVWIGWSTRLTSEASGCKVYGFDTFTGLVEDWEIDDQTVLKRGAFSLTEPLATRLMSDTGVTTDDDGVPVPLGRNVKFIKGPTYDTLTPFLATKLNSPIRLFHMDLDTYESCLHALEACKDHFIPGSILVFDEYLVTNAEMKAFYEFQQKYGLEWHYRAWGLEVGEMNIEMVTSRWKRAAYYLVFIAVYWLGAGGNFVWAAHSKRFWRFWGGAPLGDILFALTASGQRKSVSLEITGLGELAQPHNRERATNVAG